MHARPTAGPPPPPVDACVEEGVHVGGLARKAWAAPSVAVEWSKHVGSMWAKRLATESESSNSREEEVDSSRSILSAVFVRTRALISRYVHCTPGRPSLGCAASWLGRSSAVEHARHS